MLNNRIDISVSRFGRIVAAAILIVTALSLTLSTANYFVRNSSIPPESKKFFNDRFFYAFFLGSEQNLPTWYASMSLMGCAALFALNALLEKPAGGRFTKHWLGLSCFFVLLSLDEYAIIHETTGEILTGALLEVSGVSLPSAVFELVLVAIGAGVYWRFLAALPADVRKLLFLAAAAFVGGAMVVEIFAKAYVSVYSTYGVGFELLIYLEEILEMVGVGFLIYALVSHARQRLQNKAISITLTD